LPVHAKDKVESDTTENERLASSSLITGIADKEKETSADIIINGEREENKISFPIDKPNKEIVDPVVFDFSSADWVDYFYIRKNMDGRIWFISDKWEFDSDKPSYVLVKEEEDPIDLMVPPWIYIGQPDMTDYRFSFDLLLGENDFVRFSPFYSDMMTDFKYGDEIREQYSWFVVGTDYGLWLETSLDQGSYRIDEKIPDIYWQAFKKNEWNHIELYLEEMNLHMSLNGYDLGVVFTFEKKPQGSVAIGSLGGSCFKNIAIKF